MKAAGRSRLNRLWRASRAAIRSSTSPGGTLAMWLITVRAYSPVWDRPGTTVASVLPRLPDNSLDAADNLADQRAPWSTEGMTTARELIGDLVLVIRRLLIEHELQPSGDCKVCAAVWPCPVVVTIHAVLKDPDRQFVALVPRSHENE